ncbi:hypothetical protein PFICI_14538 [Pestalotiopsis fici W106-1]|uniref:Uncharacterized protein n=1 Tax=Pestalotiopsis fici (strain W106-1 / CGMCC3.15140) TaxID=1229662 RepID=W3WK99_PESFW|nr:uncharacterized protein PFICI_14538 [Pestalotiopsis fici W106-1]ETS73592.1 hypothetical protein PFICI_14538 [Pestalotiopsis fici W106-1]
MPPNPEDYSTIDHWIAPARNFRTSARLRLQHYLFQGTIGPLLEKGVESQISNSQKLRVADLACGNGVWLTELHSHLERAGITAQLEGFDVNPVLFPNPTILPKSVSFKKLDILASPLPEDLIGVFDIVHIRAFVSIIKNSEVGPVLSNALSLLKPGGFLQWEECRADRMLVQAPSEGISTEACDTIVKTIRTLGEAVGHKNDWVDVLGRHLEEHGFEDVREHSTISRKQDLMGFTEDYLMMWAELAIYFPPQAKEPQAPLTRETWTDLFEKAVRETEQGVVVHQGKLVVAVGRKPL